MTAPADLADRVRRRLAAHDPATPVDASGDPGAAIDRDAVAVAVRAESSGVVDDAVFAALRRDVEAELTGAGPLEPLLAEPGVTDVLVNAPEEVWVDRGRGVERAAIGFTDEAAVRALAHRLAAAAGRRLDDAAPYVDAVLPDGTRMHAVLPPLAGHTTISLRVLARRRAGLDELARTGSLPEPALSMMRAVVAARLAFVIVGGTGTGKTTLLAALLELVPHHERLLVIEDAPELAIDHPHVVRLVPRAANIEGAGTVELRDLVRQALRMRPDRLIVGEFRGVEMVDLLVALNTGHEGGAATLHANSSADVPARVAALGALAGLTPGAVTSLVASALDVVVALRRDPPGRGGQRRVDEIAVLVRDGERLASVPAWTAAAGIGPGASRLRELIASRDVEW